MEKAIDSFLKQLYSHFWKTALVLFLFGLLTYSNSFNNAFLMDDYPMLISNPQEGDVAFLQLDLSSEKLIYFRPVTHLFNFITFAFFADNPFGYHFLNLFLFWLAALVLYQILVTIFQDKAFSFLTALFFLVHPINGICINYKNATADAMLVLALNLSLLNAFFALEEKSFSRQILSLIWLMIAVFCHEIALAFPLYLAALLYFSRRYSIRQIFRGCASSVLLLTGYFVFRMFFASLKTHVLDQIGNFHVTILEHIATYTRLIFWYIARLIVPQDIVLMWNTPIVKDEVGLWLFLFLIIFGGTVMLIVRLNRTQPKIAFGAAWFLIGLLPVSLACLSRPWFGYFIEPFWLIYSSIGFSIVFSAFLLELKKMMNPWKWKLIMIFLIGGLIFSSRQYNDLWSSQIRYCRYWISVSPRNYFPQFWLAYSYLEKKDYIEAKVYFEKLFEDGFDYEETLGNLGIIEYHLENPEKALYFFQKALLKSPNRADTHYYLGLVYQKLGDEEKAVVSLERAVSLEPFLLDAKKELAKLYLSQGELEKSAQLEVEILHMEQESQK
ncbi:MAG: tetratricopeptide repeat protein [Candidatus Omnitrophica bacterium]|nr:tetratricopeptide repeat protein [Candidatus Omnitrophota bacterium]